MISCTELFLPLDLWKCLESKKNHERKYKNLSITEGQNCRPNCILTLKGGNCGVVYFFHLSFILFLFSTIFSMFLEKKNNISLTFLQVIFAILPQASDFYLSLVLYMEGKVRMKTKWKMNGKEPFFFHYSNLRKKYYLGNFDR